MSDVKSILLVGVGGQGTILASKILSQGLIDFGYDVKMSEIHGMSQRGGSVSTQIRYGRKVDAPIVGMGEADYIVAFEEMEALRWISYLKPGGTLIINELEIPSIPILMGVSEYPQGIIGELKNKADVLVCNASKIAEDLGNPKVMNIVLLGTLTKILDLDEVDWKNAIRKTIKPKFADLNINAFEEGEKYAR